jgi:hypothetical protein
MDPSRQIIPNYTLSEDQVLIITVAQITQLGPLMPVLNSYKKITPDSDEIFETLGVHSKAQRKRLLGRAERLDYIGIVFRR